MYLANNWAFPLIKGSNFDSHAFAISGAGGAAHCQAIDLTIKSVMRFHYYVASAKFQQIFKHLFVNRWQFVFSTVKEVGTDIYHIIFFKFNCLQRIHDVSI